MNKQTVSFTFGKSTKNTHVYVEDGEPAQNKVGALYIKKLAFNGSEPPAKIKVTIEEAK